jgi:hemerythrin-like metal-binding protein
MALLTWNDAYSVKIKEIDLQHQKLVELVNELHHNMKQGKGKEIVGKILHDLVDYTVYHFATEEKLFAKYSYPDSRVHIREHQDLVEQVSANVKEFEKGKGVLPMDLMEFLKNWLVNHIAKSDKNYSSFFNSKGIY